jgi:predicted nucleotidyltransferase
MHLTSFSLGIIVAALTISKGLFNLMMYVIIGSIVILLFSFVYNYVRGIDYMATNHPDYKGDDLFEEEDNDWDFTKKKD